MKQRYEDGVVPEGNAAARREIARQMKQARKESCLTQQTLAERIGTRTSNISRMESGTYNPSLDFLVKAAAGMGKRVRIVIE